MYACVLRAGHRVLSASSVSEAVFGSCVVQCEPGVVWFDFVFCLSTLKKVPGSTASPQELSGCLCLVWLINYCFMGLICQKQNKTLNFREKKSVKRPCLAKPAIAQNSEFIKA